MGHLTTLTPPTPIIRTGQTAKPNQLYYHQPNRCYCMAQLARCLNSSTSAHTILLLLVKLLIQIFSGGIDFPFNPSPTFHLADKYLFQLLLLHLAWIAPLVAHQPATMNIGRSWVRISARDGYYL